MIEALDRFGLLTEKTVLAHSNFITETDMDHLARTGSAVAHCPLSNSYFANSVFATRRALNHGTDISGGFSPSLFDAARTALVASRAACAGTDPMIESSARGPGDTPLNTTEVFWMATKGGGDDISLPVGAFVKGHHFDALAIKAGVSRSGFRVDPSDSFQDIFEKIVLTTGPSAIETVWINGTCRAPSP